MTYAFQNEKESECVPDYYTYPVIQVDYTTEDTTEFKCDDGMIKRDHTCYFLQHRQAAFHRK